MPKSLKPRPGPDASDLPDVDPAAGVGSGSDLGAIMAAIKQTEQNVLAKIDSSVMAAAGELHKKIDNLASDLRTEILNVRAEFAKAIEEIQKESATFSTRIDDLEEEANGQANRVVALEAKVDTLSTQVAGLADKTDDLESRQRRDNCRLIGVEEGFGNIRPERAVAELLKEALALDYTPTLDRAHRSLQPRPKDGDAPRPIIVKFHYFQEKVDVLRKAMRAGPITHNGKRFYIYPDYSAAVRKKRAAFTEWHCKLKSALKKKFQCVFEGIAKAGNPTLLNQIYTELYITKGGTAEVNDEHEVRQIETASRKPDRPETTIRQEDIFKASPGRDEPIRTVLTKGVAGIGKTVLTQKYTLDWAEDKANQDFQFIFPFTFRELNVLKEEKFSLVELVHHFFTETKEAGICSFEDFQVVFIFDGLDECRLPLDFHKTTILTDPRKSTSVDVLPINLIRGNLLPSAQIWVTTRPAAANQIPPQCFGVVTEVRGFTDPQKEEYFRKRFRDEEQASRIISHIKTSRSLHIMCHIPVFCWITATVLEDVLETREGGQVPNTLTEMYIHFLVVQAKVKKVKYDGGAETDPHWSPESRKMIESLGKLAFDQLQKGNLIFYEPDLTECGINIRAASVYSGVFTQIFKEERGLYQDKVSCFIHLSVQEFLAALHVHLTFINSGLNLPEEQQTTCRWLKLFNKRKSHSLHQSAVNKALQSPNGHLDLFLRFLLGLSLQTNQTLLRGMLTQTGSSSQTSQETVQYIKERLSEDLSAEKSINLFHCLNELNDRSLVEEIQQSLRSGRLSTDKLSPAQWSALVFILLSSEKDLDVFDLRKYSASEEALLKLLPVVGLGLESYLSCLASVQGV
ncbi:unnamed protein product [Oreochromis niloticus]|nr:unnamed protein product [Mustela putorius furo]